MFHLTATQQYALNSVFRCVILPSSEESIEIYNTLFDWKNKNRGKVPKTLFPALLKTIVELIKNIKQNAIPGFKAYRLIPYDRNQVLKKLSEDNKNV